MAKLSPEEEERTLAGLEAQWAKDAAAAEKPAALMSPKIAALANSAPPVLREPLPRPYVVRLDEVAPTAAPALSDLGVAPAFIEAVHFDPLLLEEEFARMASDTAYWNTLYAQAEEAAGYAELAVKRTEAWLQIKYRQRAEDLRQKVTEAMIAAQVELDDELYEAKVAAVRAEANRVKVKGWCSSLSVKRDMLIQQGAHVREELKGDPSLRATMAGGAAMNRARRLGDG